MTIRDRITEIFNESCTSTWEFFHKLQVKGRMDDLARDKIILALVDQVAELEARLKIEPAVKKNKDKVPLYNPTSTFSTTFDIDGTNNPQTITIHGGEVEYFTPPVAEHLKKHLATHILNERGISTNSENDLRLILAEIEVVL